MTPGPLLRTTDQPADPGPFAEDDATSAAIVRAATVKHTQANSRSGPRSSGESVIILC